MRKITLPNLNRDRRKPDDRLYMFRQRILKQGLLSLCAVLLTVVLVFAMTTAWYSNVAQTSNLTFETAAWKDENGVTITVEQAPIQAAPGLSGVVPISITNNNDNPVSVTVTAKALESESSVDDVMNNYLRKRIFLYVDATQTQNGETMDRVYLSGSSGYTYTVRSQELLVLANEYHNDALVCWEWVYDMLGYYVQGTYTTPENGESYMAVERYLRPIVYDYDKATFDAEGKLATVDGTTTAADFLTELTRTDGYPGTWSAEEPTMASKGGYYPISVNAEGSGVWAYFCTYSEIEQGIAEDTAFCTVVSAPPAEETEEGSAETETGGESEAAEPVNTLSTLAATFGTALCFTAENEAAPLETAVADAAELQSVFTQAASGDAQAVRLNQDISLTEALIIPDHADVVLDLNEHTLTVPAGGGVTTLITAGQNANISIRNGVIDGNNTASLTGVAASGAMVTLNDVTMQNMAMAVLVTDNLGEGVSCVKIKGSTISTSQTAILIQGNGPENPAVSRLIVEDTEITSHYIGISGQGSASGDKQYWGTDIQIIRSRVIGLWAGVYQPQQKSTMTIADNSHIEGYTGVAVKGGEVTIRNSTVLGTGESQEPAAASSGWTDTGDGVYVEATYPWKASVVIDGGCTITSQHRKAVELYQREAGELGSIRIYGTDNNFASGDETTVDSSYFAE